MGQPLLVKRLWLWIAGVAAIPVAAAGATGLQSSIVQNGAPVAIDRCAVQFVSTAATGSGDLSESVDFTNVSQQTVTQVRFEFEAVGSSGLTERAVTGDKAGTFAPGAGNDSGTPADDMKQTIDALPSGSTVLCKVQTVRFDDGSVWRDGDSPAGSALMFTPGPSPTTQWQWPYDTPRPR